MHLFRKIPAFLAVLITIAGSSTVSATRSYNKQWDGAVVVGSIPKSPFQYYLEPQIRFIDEADIFNQFLLLGGMGYPFSSTLSLFAGPGWILTKTTQGDTTNEIRFWQQLNWGAVRNSTLSLDSRTRLEERINTQYSQVALRFRERLWIRMPFKNLPKYSFSFFDEVFFNLNHPEWTSPRSFEQNRAFIGIAKQLTNNVSIDAGYLNQYLRSNRIRMDNVLLVLFSVRT